MGEGLKISLEEELMKNSEIMGKDCIYKKIAKINRLPSYLTVQFVRFYWKKASAVAGTKEGKAKILRNVAFPKVFDIYEFCTEELKKGLN